MKYSMMGAIIGGFLAFMMFSFGFWGLLLTALFMLGGAFIGQVILRRVIEEKLDVRGAIDVLLGRRSSS